jgi:branched-chain amino acid aminotransferase
MAFPGSGPIWFDGDFVPWQDANIHVMSHVIHYGSGVFEGIRCYKTKTGPAVFRLKEHMQRLIDSAKIYRMAVTWSVDELCEAVLETIRKNELESCYIRPLVYRGYGEMGVNPLKCPVKTAIGVWEWGQYLGPEALEQGVNVCVSSWNRAAPNTFPSLAKACGNYLNSQLVKMEALENGFDEGIVLDVNGLVSEGSGENLFLIKNGAITTTQSHSSILPGITRHSVMVLARELGYEVHSRQLPRESLYIADELFFTGTAAEVTPIATVDHIEIGSGKCGEITKRVQDELFGILNGETEDRHNWLTLV